MRDLMVITKQKRWERYVIDHSFDLMDLQLFTSCSMALDFLDSGCVKRDSVRMVYNGVDCDHFTPGDGGSELVSVGRISPEKGLDELRKVVANLRETFPGMRCRIAGSGEPQTFEELEYAGHVDDIREFLKAAAIYISTSHTEGLSMALLEAQACGVPAVARTIGANSEVIEQGVTGFLCSTIGGICGGGQASLDSTGSSQRDGKECAKTHPTKVFDSAADRKNRDHLP